MSTPSADQPWRTVASSNDIGPGTIFEVPESNGDPEVVVWRSSSGVLCAMDARCPHQFSHLGAEGQVDGEEIVCCSHWWRFGNDGNASYLNRDGSRDEKAATIVYPVQESNGEVQVRLR